MKPHFNSKEREIIRALHSYGGLLSAHEISQITGISYITVVKYLKKLEKERWVIHD